MRSMNDDEPAEASEGQLRAGGQRQKMPANAPNSICNQLFGENGPGMPSDGKYK